MTYSNQSPFAFLLNADIPIYFSSCGVTTPAKEFFFKSPVTRFGTFLLVKGSLNLIDEFPQGTQEYCLKQGVVHSRAPGLYQQTSMPKTKGNRYLWYNFVQNAPYKILSEKETIELIQTQFLQNKPQKFLTIPIHFESKNLFYKLVELHGQLDQQVKKWGNADIGSHILCNHLIYSQHQELVNRFTESLVNKDFKRSHVRKAQEIILNSCANVGTLSQLAEILQLNPSYLSRCFKECTGVTVQHYIQHCRIEAAIQMIRQGNKSIKTIAFESGFTDTDYFCKVFKKITGKTTSEFRVNS